MISQQVSGQDIFIVIFFPINKKAKVFFWINYTKVNAAFGTKKNKTLHFLAFQVKHATAYTD